MMYNGAPRYRPYLQPTGGLGQQSRTGASLLISSPRNTIVLGTGPRVQPKSLLNIIA